ncbi:BLUF domain-containing protein [Dyadobacter sp. CY326]|uniref:BLUF domain-containing protein n=1 Tax=Dyadobacter sp. CY326 TaxID=2907300 RepID=UPI001F42A6F3|nr:BLUF domain-containing protein [Dyadobacter sp. CY326]MCE7065053.1 BLUF domain-containing protein [Dyadobacter sp. CY326]
MEYSLIYLSSSKGLFTDDEISLILKQSHANNVSLNITGVLLYCNGSIIQVLEGPKEKVEGLYEKISKDDRHRSLVRLYAGEIQQRSFSDWLMGYRTLSTQQFDHLQEHLTFVKDPLSPPLKSDGVAMTLLRSFFQNNYRN